MSTEKAIMPKSPAYLWFDAEFTSLDLDHASFIQVALMATDAELNRLLPGEEDLNLYLQLGDDVEVSEWVQTEIPEIVEAARSPQAVTVAEAEKRILAYIEKAVGPNPESVSDRPLLAGNSIHNDWHIARRLMPDFIARCHYRLVDVSMLKVQWQDTRNAPAGLIDKDDPEWVKQWFPSAAFHGLTRAHDAHYDIQASAAELAFYRSEWLGN